MDDHQDAGGWGALEFQLANWWTVQEPAAARLPVDHQCMSIDIDMYGTRSLPVPAYVPHQSCVGQQLVEYYSTHTAPSQQNCSPVVAEVIHGQNNRQVTGMISGGMQQQVVDLQTEEETKHNLSNDSRVSGVFEQVSHEFGAHIDMRKEKMHRYPASLHGALHDSWTVPRVVAIGPYHHGREHLKPAEKVKHIAAIRCVVESGRLLEEVYSAVVSAADDVRRLGLYDKDVMAGIGYDDFRHMMFFDACFMVQYMRWGTRLAVDESLRGFVDLNDRDINRDFILLENQLPWKVVEAVLRFTPEVRLESFISRWKGYVQHYGKPKDDEADAYVQTLVKDSRFKPHLLGLLRYYTVGRRSRDAASTSPNKLKPKNPAVSVSAIELAEIGITLTANKTMKLIDMDLKQEGTLLAELSLAPLFLDRNRASYLLNMAALELCTVSRFGRAPVEESTVCSYLQLLALLVSREEDVQELRERGLLQGGGGLTNQEAFCFFTSFQGLRLGKCYYRVMAKIEGYKEKRRVQTRLYAFFYKHKKTMAAVATVFGALGGIIGTLLSMKKAL